MNPLKLALLMYILAAPTLAGIAMIAVLSMPDFSTRMLLSAAAAGFVAAIPAAWLVARNLSSRKA